jgi:hypothetical protein
MVFSEGTATAYSIEVKANSKRGNFWLVGKKALGVSSRSHFYVLVNISSPKDGADLFEFYVVPSGVVARKSVVKQREASTWCSFSLKNAEPYRNKWAQLGEK